MSEWVCGTDLEQLLNGGGRLQLRRHGVHLDVVEHVVHTELHVSE